MATLLKAECAGCGFEQANIPAGFGMLERDGICRVPALCRTCGRVVVINLFDPVDRSCVDCGNRVFLYTDPKQQSPSSEGRADADDAFWWGGLPTRSAEYCLTRANCTCPKCGQMLPRFGVTARTR